MAVHLLDKHIEITPDIVGGKPRIAGSRITVQNIAIWHERMGMSADEISAEYNISLADVFAALAFYFDYRQEIDESIHEDEAFANSLRHRSKSKINHNLRAQYAV